jgi:hypothetical protein
VLEREWQTQDHCGRGASANTAEVSTASSAETAESSDSEGGSNSDPIAAIQAAIASGSISSLKGQQLENRIAAIERLAATDPGLDMSQLESAVLAALPAPVAPTTNVVAATSTDNSQSTGMTPTVTVAALTADTTSASTGWNNPTTPVVNYRMDAGRPSAPGSLAPLIPIPNNAATVPASGSALSAGRESLLTQLFQEFGEGPLNEAIHFEGPTVGALADLSLGDTVTAGPAQISENASRTVFDALGLDFAGTTSNGSRHANGDGWMASDSAIGDWSDEFLYAISAFGDSSTEAD